MKTGILLYSQTNNTLSVGERLLDALSRAGHSVTLERVTTAGTVKQSKGPLVLLNKPGTAPYDYVIFGAPVQAFSLCPVMKAYMAQLAPLSGKKAACFVTQHFKRPWMGGNQAIGRMTHSIEDLGGKVIHTGTVNWSSAAREEQIERLIAILTEKASDGAGDSQ